MSYIGETFSVFLWQSSHLFSMFSSWLGNLFTQYQVLFSIHSIMDGPLNINMVLQRLARLNFNPSEEDVLLLDETTAQQFVVLGENRCYESLLLGPYYNFCTLKTILNHAWSKVEFHVRKMQDGTFQFFVQSRDEMENILENTPRMLIINCSY